MNRKQIIEAVAQELLHRQDAQTAVRRVFSLMADSLRDGEKVVISNFGTFHPVSKSARRARNPLTGAAVAVPPRLKFRFKPSKRVFR
ncbi:MAG: HU family DNA-binding protein [Elusimicrobia bacterium]|nr:HU family DNA-binding protein [Elusimicrobiota bacterium]